MNLLDTMQITASGLTAQRVRLQTIASNMANARTTRTEDGGPYQRRMPVFEARSVEPFGDLLAREMVDFYYSRFLADERLQKPLLSGHEVMELLSIPPGPLVGEVLRALVEAQSEGRITTREEARKFALSQFKVRRF